MQRSVYGETQFEACAFSILKQLLEKMDMPYLVMLVTTLNEFVTIVKKLAKTQRDVSSSKKCWLLFSYVKVQNVGYTSYRTSCQSKCYV